MKVLIFTKNWVGDMFFQLPAIDAVRRRYPDAEIVCAAPPRCAEFLKHYPAVDRVLAFDEKAAQRMPWALLAFLLGLRREKWDLALLLHKSRTRAWLAKLAGARERIGYDYGRAALLTRAVPVSPKPLHQLDFFTHLMREAGFEIPADTRYRIFPSRRDRENVNELLLPWNLQDKPFVCFHLGANWEPKRWPAGRFAELADKVADAWQLPVVITGGDADKPLGEQMLRLSERARVISFIGETSLTSLAALFQRAVCVVSGDSGPMHIAAAAGTPVVALFGPTDPDLTGPRGTGPAEVLRFIPEGFHAPWFGQDLPGAPWLSGIQAEDVFEVIQKRQWMRLPGDRSAEDPKSRRRMKARPRVPRDAAPASILVVTLNNIGDVILNTPVIAALRENFADAEISVVTGPLGEAVLKGSEQIKRVLVYDKHVGLLKKLEFLKALRAERYDWVIDLRNTAIPFLARARKRSPVFRKYQKTLMRDRHLEVLNWMGVQALEKESFDLFGPEEAASMREKLDALRIQEAGGWILAAPVARSELKTWRLSGFKFVLEGLLEETGKPVLLIGSDRERPLVEKLTEIAPERVLNLAGQTSMRELAWLVHRSSLLLTNDSAAMHLGFELQRPVAAVFGPTDPAQYGREGDRVRVLTQDLECRPCRQPICRLDKQVCFDDLAPEKVLRACRELLAGETLLKATEA